MTTTKPKREHLTGEFYRRTRIHEEFNTRVRLSRGVSWQLLPDAERMAMLRGEIYAKVHNYNEE